MPKPELWDPASGASLFNDRKLWIDYARELEAQVTERTFDLDLAQADLSTARARIAELEAREQRIREAGFHPLLNSLEYRATIKTILTLG